MNPLDSRVAAPYARALFDLSREKNIIHQITGDFQNLEDFLNASSEFEDYLNKPTVSTEAKIEFLEKTLKAQLYVDTFKFLLVLVKRDRITALRAVITNYLELVYELASIKVIEVVTGFPFSDSQKETLIEKLKELTDVRQVTMRITVDSSLIGGFLIKTESKVIDYTIRNQLQKLAQHLDTLLEI